MDNQNEVTPDAFWLSQMKNVEGLGVAVSTATGDCIGISINDIDGFCAALRAVAAGEGE